MNNTGRKTAFFRALLKRARKVVAIFAAMAVDKHLEYDQEDIEEKSPGKEKKSS